MSNKLWFLAIPKYHSTEGTHCTLTVHRGVTRHDANVFYEAMSAAVLRHRKVVARRRENLDIKVLDQTALVGVNDDKPARLVALRNLAPLIVSAERLLPRERFGGSKHRPIPHVTDVPGIRVDAQVWRDVDLVVHYNGLGLLLPRLPTNW